MGWLSSAGDFLGGLGTGVYEGGKGLVEGVAGLAKGGYALATSSDAREQAWDTTKGVASAVKDYGGEALEDPAMVWRDAKNAAGEAYTAAEEFAETADAEDWGELLGRGAFEVGTAVVPVSKVAHLGKVGKAAKLADKADDLADAGKVLKTAGKLDDAADAGKLASKADDIAMASKGFADEAVEAIQGCPAKTKARLTATETGEVMVDGVPVSKLSNNKKGIFGEAMADGYAKSKGWEKVSNGGVPTSLDDKIQKGIDAVYKDPGPPPRFIIADAKYGTAKLSKLKDGTRQMSDDWIEPRLSNAVDKKTQRVIARTGYERVVLRVEKTGKVVEEILD